ncbi:MAG: DUF4301 family protein [Bacteroidales bacterium]|nr:DUF4301 family protein [Bacteroidales bacterium]
MFSESNLHEIQFHGLTLEQVEKQIKRFETGFSPMNIVAPATLECGIKHFEDDEIADFAKLYEKKKRHKKMVKFVPASGAASRMFKMLFTLLNEYDGSEESYNKFFTKTGLHTPKNFIDELPKFAFYEDLVAVLAKDGFDINTLLAKKDYKPILEYLLTAKGLNYGNLPKGLLQFHKYATENRTPLEEHMVEGALYAKNHNKDVNLHFTVSPEFMDGFKNKVIDVKAKYQSNFSVKYYVDYSIQKPTTDTIAVNPDNTPFQNADGTLLFRPAGHGALIENLNELNYDIIFIKNIDNIVPDDYKDTTTLYKKALAGILIHYQSEIFHFYKKIRGCRHLSDKRLRKAIDFLQNELYYMLPEGFENWARNDCKDYLIEILHRPIRVCGMVKNEGEPGGGPFFVLEKDGAKTLQIIEKAQIDTKSKEQEQIFNQSTHFNPVDLVCAVKDYDDKKFDLTKYIDEEAGIITSKSKDGKELKALELPGLWNGAMSNWNTIFVEVPSITFNPVKEVNDLLRKEHQQQKQS